MPGRNSRQIALQTLLRSQETQHAVEHILARRLRAAALSSADTGLCRELVSGCVRWRRLLDWLIERATEGREQKPAVREILLARYRRYRDEGLAGIAPYDRGDGTVIDAGGELRKASLAARTIGLFRPNFYELLLDYPKFRPAGFEESFFWIHYRAHGEPAFMLTHRLSVPSDPEAGSVQRQFYVSRSYNVEQSLSTLVSVREGTLVVYTNRTSTDQVTGFGAAARRSIGRKLLASQLEGLYTRVRADAAKRP